MKKLLTGTFLLFYLTISVALVVERTSLWATTFEGAGKSRSSEIRAKSDHSGQRRIVDHSFIVCPDHTTVTLTEFQSHSRRIV
jgi:hypothetical protein